MERENGTCRKDEVFRLFRDCADDATKGTFDKLLKLLIQNQSVRLRKPGMRVTAERKPKIERK